MNCRRLLLSIAFAAIVPAAVCSAKDKSIKPVPFTDVTITGGFWQERIQTELDVTVPFSVGHCAPAVERFRQCADYLSGKSSQKPIPHRFISSDMYKVMEGVAYSLMLRKNEELEAWMDTTIALIGSCQQEDGYLYITHMCGNPAVGEMGPRPYTYVVHSHELYNMDHLYEAAVAYWQATGKTSLMEIAEKSARHINKVFFEGDPAYNDGKPVNQAPGHEEIELALCKMYRATGERFYLDLAKKFLEIRGVTYCPDGTGVNAPDYAQQHMPVAQQREAVGHSVRALYLYTGMAQVDALLGESDYAEALDAIWTNLVSARMHVTGGLGAGMGIEGFGENYYLPNKTAYNETCAACANVFFNESMFLTEGDAKYLDVAELSLFNNALAGISLSGDRFFYVNPLEADDRHAFNFGSFSRAEWFGCACCPPNISRLILQAPGYMYAYGDKDIYVTLYAQNRVTVPLKRGNVAIDQTTSYPFEGTVKLTVNPEKKSAFGLGLRIPTWAQGEDFTPLGLYSYVRKDACKVEIRVNGEQVPFSIDKGFATIRRRWKKGDVVEIDLGMQPRRIAADARVKEDESCQAVVMGPVVFCAEGVDNCCKVQELSLAEGPIEEKPIAEGPLKGLPSLKTSGSLADGTQTSVTFVPYYAWDNRGPQKTMKVWIPTKE